MASKLFDLSGRVALITGGNSGIGLGMAEGLAEHGCDICIWGTNASKNEAALETLQQYGTRVRSQVCNVADAREVEQAFAQTLKDFGRVDGCFANAGVGGGGVTFDEFSDEEWHRVIGVNLHGVFHTFKWAAKHMRERAKDGDSFGRLVGTASLAAISGQPRGEHYAATKGGLISMIRALAVEYARYSVTANVILPGWIETAMTEGSMGNPRFADAVMRRIPVRRWGEPADFAGIALYLMSTASNYHTADSFLIDGGYAVF
ncbi:MAG: SDR family NAD(P)-dependent oxidoreductase [Pseudomonadota bacterium]